VVKGEDMPLRFIVRRSATGRRTVGILEKSHLKPQQMPGLRWNLHETAEEEQ
jgi:hypothetical protein